MEIFGRNLLDYNDKIPVTVDNLVFVVNGHEIVISLYTARKEGRIEVRCNTGCLDILPQASNSIEVRGRR